MKKFSVILLIAVLAMTSVFADPITIDAAISGSATAKYTVDFDEASYGYTKPALDSKVTLTLGGAKATKNHTTDLWAEMTASVTYKLVGDIDATPTATLGTFMIHKDSTDVTKAWTWDLTKAASVANLATSFDVAWDNSEQTVTGLFDNKPVVKANGTTFNWNGFVFAAAINGGFTEDATHEYYFGATTPDFTIKNTGMKIQGAGALKYTTEDAWNIYGSLAIAYANDATEPTIAVKASTDQSINFGEEFLGYDVDARLDMTFSPVDINVYFANRAEALKGNEKYVRVKNLLSVQATADLSDVAPIVINVKGLNLLKPARILSADVTYTFVKDKFDITAFAYDLLSSRDHISDIENVNFDHQLAYLRGNFEGQKVGVKSTLTFGDVKIVPEVFYRIALKELGANAAVTYTNDNFVVNGGIKSSVELGTDNACFKVNAGITTTLVENATLAFAYASRNLIMGTEYKAPICQVYGRDYQPASPAECGAGTATVSCTVTF